MYYKCHYYYRIEHVIYGYKVKLKYEMSYNVLQILGARGVDNLR